MKLYMKQKVISWGDKFTVTDESGEVLYTVEGEVPSFGHKLHIYDHQHDEVAFIHQKLLSLLGRYFVTVNGQEAAEVVKEISIMHPKYSVKGPDWEAAGDVMGHNYEIKKGGETVAAVHWKWMSWGDSYEIDVSNDADEVLVLAVVLTIDAVNFDMNSSQAAANSVNATNNNT